MITSVSARLAPRPPSRESGQVFVMVVLASVVLIGFAALAIDGGNLYTEQRRAQAAADNAALAAAFAQMNGEDIDALEAAALENASINAYNNDTVTNWVTYHQPPTAGPYAGDDDFIEVQIRSVVKNTALLHFIYTGPVEVRARAVAHGVSAQPVMEGYAIATMYNDCGASVKVFTPRGGVASIVKDGGVFVNVPADCDTSIDLAGGNARLATTSSVNCPDDSHGPRDNDDPTGCYISGQFPITVGGGQDEGTTCAAPSASSPIDWWSNPGTNCNFWPAVTTNAANQFPPDPLETLEIDCGENQDATLTGSPVHIGPGSYTDLNIGNKDLIMDPGIYCITGLGSANKIFDARSIYGRGVFIYIQQTNAEFKFTSPSASLDLSAPFSGENGLDCENDPNNDLCNVQGFVIYKPNGKNTCSSSDQEISFAGDGDMIIRGLIWAPQSFASFGGNGNLYMSGQAIVGCGEYAGNGELDVTYNPEDTYLPPPSVRLDN